MEDNMLVLEPEVLELDAESKEIPVPQSGTFDVKAVKAFDASLTKKFGEAYYGVSTPRKVEPATFTSTGSYNIDQVMGGGVPRSRLVVLQGAFSTGKSLIAMSAVEEHQKQGKLCFWIDVEQAMEPGFAKMCGVDMDSLGLIQPQNAEEALEALRDVVRSGLFSLVVLDSVA